MRGSKKNCLIVIEDGLLTVYPLDDRLVWEIGRPSKENMPDIRLHCTTVSRKHGRFQNIDGMWFYVDYMGTNGTVYNGKHITAGIRGRAKPIALKDKDVLIFGGGEDAVINGKTVWALFSEYAYDGKWRVEDTGGIRTLAFTDGENVVRLEHPDKGTVVEKENGMAIYMGDITYLAGNVAIMG